MPSPHPPLLAPSILAGDHADLAGALRIVESLPIRWLHLDIMDGHFVPNLSFGPQTVADLRRRNQSLFFDTHLMLANPADHVEAFARAGANQITIHVEPDYDIAATLAHIRSLGCRNGIVLNPGTPAEAAAPWLDAVDIILVMGVWPGFGGQSFIEATLATMLQLDAWRAARGLPYRLQVDGGVNLASAARCRAAGVDTFVAGTAFFEAPDRATFLAAIEQ
jgi:ribulose-phosphate 3-epimerase